jgi:F-type H+-transporting ATPase subunit b
LTRSLTPSPIQTRRSRCLFALFFPSVATLFAILLTAAPAFSQEPGETAPENSPIGWVFRWLNFAIVFGGIAYALVKFAAPKFRERTNNIEEAILEGTRARELAEKQRLEAEKKLAGIDEEVAALRAHAQREGQTAAERIREGTKEEAAKVEKAAEVEIEAAERAARLELKALAAGLAVERAESLLRQELTPSRDSKILSDFVARVAGSSN